MLNYKNAKKEFDQYINNYNMNDDKIVLKYKHTFDVVEVSEYIANSLNLAQEEIELAKIIALLHDIGRFEQIKQYNSFNDAKTFNHGEYAVKILFQDGLIRKFVSTDEYDSVIERSILNHNRYQINNDLSEIELRHAKIIRDADKIDILKIFYENPVEEIMKNCNSTSLDLEISLPVYQLIIDKKSVMMSEKKTTNDEILTIIAFIFDINFQESIKYLNQKKYVEKMLNKIRYNEEDKEKINNIKKIVISYLQG